MDQPLRFRSRVAGRFARGAERVGSGPGVGARRRHAMAVARTMRGRIVEVARGHDHQSPGRSSHPGNRHQLPRCDRSQASRGTVPSGTEDGVDRPARRRHRARLQQPADRHQRQSRTGHDGDSADRSALRVPRRRRQGGGLGHQPDAATADVLPEAGDRSEGDQPERRPDPRAQTARAADRRGHQSPTLRWNPSSTPSASIPVRSSRS